MKNDLSAPETQHIAIEQLMGHGSLQKSLNTTSQVITQRQIPLESLLLDYQVCKSYIVGQCPYDLFQKTKEYHGKCPQLHVSKYKLMFQRRFQKLLVPSKSDEEDKENEETYQSELNLFLEFNKHYYETLSSFIKKCDVTKQKAIIKLESKTEDERQKISQVSQQLDDIDEMIGLLTKEVEVLIAHKDIDKATQQGTHIGKLQSNRIEVAKQVREFASKVAKSDKQELQVCNVCGAYLSRLDSDKRLADHFLGKIHLNYVSMRQELFKLRKLFKKNRVSLTNPNESSNPVAASSNTQHLSRRYIQRGRGASSPGARFSTSSTPYRGRGSRGGRGRGVSNVQRPSRFQDQSPYHPRDAPSNTGYRPRNWRQDTASTPNY